MSIRLFLLIVLMHSCSQEQKVELPKKDLALIHSLNEEVSANLTSESQTLNRKLKLLSLQNDRITTLENIVRPNVLFFYFSGVACSECVDREIDIIKKVYKSDQVILIGKEYNVRNLLVLKRLKKIPFDMYYMTMEESLDISSESLQKPILFRINKQFNPYNIYTPKFSYPEFSSEYHKTIFKLLNIPK